MEKYKVVNRKDLTAGNYQARTDASMAIRTTLKSCE